MLILTINTGSSSLRLSLFAENSNGLERLAEVHHDVIDTSGQSQLGDFIASVDVAEIGLVVHRVVHGGARFTAPCLINAAVEEEIERLIPLAPLHNSVAMIWIRHARQLLGERVPQVAVFDTAFYRNLPEVAATYALPRELCQRHDIRRYGFHGIAHQAMWQRWREIRSKIKGGGQVISVQLGSGCSITAIDNGMPVDTSMGFSPLEGLVMATRSGDIDPTVMAYLQREAGLSANEIEQILNKQSGLLGISGDSGDMRVLLNSNTPEAELAVDIYCYRVRKYIGAYLAVLGGVDAILFGGGVGENSAQVREKILRGMGWLGMELDPLLNDTSKGKEVCVSTEKSQSEVWVVPVDEAQMMALDAMGLVNEMKCGEQKI